MSISTTPQLPSILVPSAIKPRIDQLLLPAFYHQIYSQVNLLPQNITDIERLITNHLLNPASLAAIILWCYEQKSYCRKLVDVVLLPFYYPNYTLRCHNPLITKLRKNPRNKFLQVQSSLVLCFRFCWFFW